MKNKKHLIICILFSIISILILIFCIYSTNKILSNYDYKTVNNVIGVIIDIEEIEDIRVDPPVVSTYWVLTIKLPNDKVININKYGSLTEEVGDNIKVYTDNGIDYELSKIQVASNNSKVYLFAIFSFVCIFISIFLWQQFFGWKYVLLYLGVLFLVTEGQTFIL